MIKWTNGLLFLLLIIQISVLLLLSTQRSSTLLPPLDASSSQTHRIIGDPSQFHREVGAVTHDHAVEIAGSESPSSFASALAKAKSSDFWDHASSGSHQQLRSLARTIANYGWYFERAGFNADRAQKAIAIIASREDERLLTLRSAHAVEYKLSSGELNSMVSSEYDKMLKQELGEDQYNRFIDVQDTVNRFQFFILGLSSELGLETGKSIDQYREELVMAIADTKWSPSEGVDGLAQKLNLSLAEKRILEAHARSRNDGIR